MYIHAPVSHLDLSVSLMCLANQFIVVILVTNTFLMLVFPLYMPLRCFSYIVDIICYPCKGFCT